ncbi:MAG TPA: twin-arginine translocase TatA/TatE family subunit [Actinomycetota bacterium]|nr:twin-arginine translocase TatA/TatE family subunit [Actinomycetota bacterium]
MELLIIAFVIVLIFGAKRLPEIARSIGKAKGEFKRGLDDKPEIEPVERVDKGDTVQP